MQCAPLLRGFLLVFALASTAPAVEFKVDLRSAANRSFVDDVAGDGKGGWSDQGPENSLSGMKRGIFVYAGIEFQILGSQDNRGNQILAFDSKNDPTGLKQAEVPVAEGKSPVGRNLYLLHTACWLNGGDASPVGTVAVRCDSGRVLEFPLRPGTDIADWWNPVDLPNAIVAYREDHPSGPVGVYVSRFTIPADAGAPVALRFQTTGGALWIVLAATFTDHDPLAEASATWAPTADQGWKPADMADLEVRPGSALDLSAVFGQSGAAGENGFMTINKKGELRFEKKPDEPVRFLCCSMIDEVPPEATPEEIDGFAEQVARAGYNILRPHYLDSLLRRGGQGDDLNPKALDAWDHLAAALKARGVYLFLDISTVKPPLKVPMYYDPAARERWKAGVVALLTHVNPYTRLALKDDPMVAIGQLRNEAELNYLMAKKDANQGLAIPFREWLRKKYPTVAALQTAWGSSGGSALPPGATFETIGLPPVSGKGPATTDLQLFFVSIQREMFEWMAGTVRALGVRVPLTDFNINYSLESDLTRDVLPLVDNHTYHDHPRFFNNPNDSGTTEMANNPLLRGIAFYLVLPATRQLGRPFTVSEWGQVFWNPYRFQAGLTMPSYAALQGWQMIAQFTNPVRPAHAAKPPAQVAAEPFRLFKDPPTKAGEYMAALLFRRADVRPSPHFVEMVVDPKSISDRLALQDAAPSSITRLALVTGLGVRVPAWPGAAPRGEYHADLSLSPDGTQQILSQDGAQTIGPPANAGQAGASLFTTLHSAGVLSAGNRTDVSKGLYESDTGQIVLDAQVGSIQVATPMSQGGTLFSGGPGFRLPDLEGKLSGADGAIFAGSLTAQPLATSSRVLLLIVTDALNSGMRFKDGKRQMLIDRGQSPVLMHVSAAEISLHNTAPGNAHLWALSANGERVEEIPLTDQNGILAAHIDTAALRRGPTPYFEITRAN
jgi:hypothetical protein